MTAGPPDPPAPVRVEGTSESAQGVGDVHREHRLVVVGDGDVGAAAAYRLARASGPRVLVLDAAPDRPATQPERVVRTDVVHPDDARTALAPAALDAWRDLERLSGQRLLTPTVGVVVADRRRPDVGHLAARADRHGVDFAVLDASGLARRWPQLRPGPDDHAFVQADAGLLDADRAAAVHRVLAAGHGAEFRRSTTVRALHRVEGTDDGVEVVLDDEVVHAARVVVAAGAGTAALLPRPGLGPVGHRVERTVRHPTARMLDFGPARFPVVTWLGAAVSDAGEPLDVTGIGTHHDVATRLVEHARLDPGARRAFLADRLPGFAGDLAEQVLPARTVSGPADAAMLLGALPDEPRLAVALGTARSPMFAGVAGRALADLVLRGRTRAPLAPFAPGPRTPLRARDGDTAGRPR